MRKPSLKQQKALQYLSENIGAPLGEAMRFAGYSEATSKTPQRLTESVGWQDLLNKVEDAGLVSRLWEIAMDAPDRRSALQAIDILLKLKDRYPAGKLKVQAYNEELERLKD